MPLPSRNRLNIRHLGDNFYDKAQRIHSSHFTAFILPNSLGFPRIAILVSKKTNPLSVGRNLLRRQLSAIIQENLAAINNSLDIVLSIKPSSSTSSYQELVAATSSLLTKLQKNPS